MDIGNIILGAVLVLFEAASVTAPGEDVLVLDSVLGLYFAVTACGKLESVGIVGVCPYAGGILGVVGELRAEALVVEFEAVDDDVLVGFPVHVALREVVIIVKLITLLLVTFDKSGKDVAILVVGDVPAGFTDTGSLPVVLLGPVADSLDVSGLQDNLNLFVLGLVVTRVVAGVVA